MAECKNDIGSLLSEFSSAIKAKAYTFKPLGFEYDDLIQEGYIALFLAMSSFKSDKGVAFKTYADKCIENRMLSFMRHHSALKNSPLMNYAPIDETAALVPDPSFSMEEKETVNLLMKKISKCLSKKEKAVFDLYLQGKTPREIACLTESDNKSTQNTLYRIRSKLRKIQV